MTEQAFIDSIDCRFPYTDRDAGRQLVFEACCLSSNAAFAVLDELARPAVGIDAPVEIRQELISLLENSLKHPAAGISLVCAALAPILVPVSRRLVAGGELSIPEAIACMNAIRPHSGQYAALSLAYRSCDDVTGEADRVHKDILNLWRKNIELIEKSLSAIREDLLALQAQVTDVKKLADLVKQKLPKEGFDNSPMWRNYMELHPYMTAVQKDRVPWIFAIGYSADIYLRTGKDNLTASVARFVPLMIADLDDIAKNLNKGNSGTAKT